MTGKERNITPEMQSNVITVTDPVRIFDWIAQLNNYTAKRHGNTRMEHRQPTRTYKNLVDMITSLRHPAESNYWKGTTPFQLIEQVATNDENEGKWWKGIYLQGLRGALLRLAMLHDGRPLVGDSWYRGHARRVVLASVAKAAAKSLQAPRVCEIRRLQAEERRRRHFIWGAVGLHEFGPLFNGGAWEGREQDTMEVRLLDSISVSKRWTWTRSRSTAIPNRLLPDCCCSFSLCP